MSVLQFNYSANSGHLNVGVEQKVACCGTLRNASVGDKIIITEGDNNGRQCLAAVINGVADVKPQDIWPNYQNNDAVVYTIVPVGEAQNLSGDIINKRNGRKLNRLQC